MFFPGNQFVINISLHAITDILFRDYGQQTGHRKRDKVPLTDALLVGDYSSRVRINVSIFVAN